MNNLLSTRANEPFFNPYNEQEILELGSSIFALKRKDKEGNKIICITNITSADTSIDIVGYYIIS